MAGSFWKTFLKPFIRPVHEMLVTFNPSSGRFAPLICAALLQVRRSLLLKYGFCAREVDEAGAWYSRRHGQVALNDAA